MRRVGKNGAQLIELTLPPRYTVGDEITRHDHDVRPESGGAVERVNDVVVTDAWSDMQIAQLDQAQAAE